MYANNDQSIMSDDILKLPSDQDISGRNLGKEELQLLKEVVSTGVLNSIRGSKVPQFEKEFADYYGCKHCIALSSGTAGVHAAIAALNPDPDQEIITTPITDMGAITPIIYQNCVPVFADVDPFTYNVTAETIQKKITPKTAAIIVTHLFGNPCEMTSIMTLAHNRQIPIIEDCSQSYLAENDGKRVGTIGHIGVFSMQQGKHMTTGEGGMVISNDANLAKRMKLFVNKAWGYGDPNPDHYFLAMNYRITELQGAVALAQLKKLSWVVEQRQKMAKLLDVKLGAIPGIQIPKITAHSTHVYWKYCLDIDKDILGFDVTTLSQELKQYGVSSVPRYIQKPAFKCQVLKDAVTFGKSHVPFPSEWLSLGQNDAWWKKEYPGSYQALSRILVLPWNEFYTETHVQYIADKILCCVENLKKSSKQ
jgi:perosamine synthetase